MTTEQKAKVSLEDATPAVMAMRDVLSNDSMMTAGYLALSSLPDVVNALDRITDRIVNGATFRVGNATRDDIHSDAMMEVAALLAMDATVTAGNVGKVVRRVAKRYEQRTVRTIPIATGLDSVNESDPTDTESESATDGSYWNDTRISCAAIVPMREGRDMLVKRAPGLLPTVVLADDYGSAPIPDDAYGSYYSLPNDVDAETLAMIADYYPGATKGSGLYDVAKREGLVKPIQRKDALGTRSKDAKGNALVKPNGETPSVLSIAVTLATLHKRTYRYSMASQLTHAQAVAIDAARSIGAIAAVTNHLGSKGDPTYMLAQSEPSAESAYFHTVKRNAETLAADETLYGGRYDVERFYVPVKRYQRTTRDKDAGKVLHIRGTVKRPRHILMGNRKGKDGKVTQQGMRDTYGDSIATIGKRLRSTGKAYRKLLAEMERTVLSYRAPFVTLAERRYVRPIAYRVSYTNRHSDPIGMMMEMAALLVGTPMEGMLYGVPTERTYSYNDADDSPFWFCETSEEDAQIAAQWQAIADAARSVRETVIAGTWSETCASDPAAMMIENAAAFGIIRSEWRLVLAAIEIGDWSAGL